MSNHKKQSPAIVDSGGLASGGGDVRGAVRRYVLEQICGGQWKVGQRVPTDAQLAKQFATSRTNVNQAIKALEREGVVRRYRRRGTFVAESPAGNADQALRRHKPRQGDVHVLAPHSAGSAVVHWNHAAVNQLESALNAAGLQVSHRSLPVHPPVAEFQQMVRSLAEESSQALVILSDLPPEGLPAAEEDKALLPYVQALLHYPGRVCWLNRAGTSLAAWPHDAVSLSPLSEGVAVGQYLKQQNVSRVICIGVLARRWSTMRVAGVEMALEEAAKPIEHNTVWCENALSADEMFSQLLCDVVDRGDRPTIVVSNDQVAAKLLRLAHDRGVRCPDTFSVISFDNDDRYLNYNITTVAPPASHLGETIGRLVIDQVRQPGNTAIKLELKSVIVERSTFAASAST